MLSAKHVAVDERELATPTTTAKYPLGLVVEFVNTSDNVTEKYIYGKAHAALTQYAPYIVVANAVAGSEIVTAAPVTNTAEMVAVGVPQVAFTSSYYGFIKIQGNSTVVTSTGLVATTYGKLINGGTSAYVSTTGALPITSSFCSCYTTTTGASASVYLMGALVSVTT